jgi:hypothetical protein
MHCIYNSVTVFDRDQNNIRKMPAEVEAALSNRPILIYEQDVEGEVRRVRGE